MKRKLRNELQQTIDGLLLNTLEKNLILLLSKLNDCWEYIFQQVVASAHIAKKGTTAKKCLEENKIQVLDWSSSSPDFNSIENLWLKAKNQEIWNSIVSEDCRKLGI